MTNQILTILALISLPILLFTYFRIRLKRLARYSSPLLGKIEVFKKADGEIVLTTNSYIQGLSINKESIKQSYWHKVASETTTHSKSVKNPQVLMLGLGANTISNLIAKTNPKIHQIIVEIDSSIIQACRDWFGLDQLPNHTLVQGDAYQVIQKKIRSQKFDAVIVDIFLGAPPYVDIKSNKPIFIKKLLPLLKKDGVMIFNRPAHKQEVRQEGFELEKYLKSLFKEVKVYDIQDPRGFRNHVITASKKLASQ